VQPTGPDTAGPPNDSGQWTPIAQTYGRGELTEFDYTSNGSATQWFRIAVDGRVIVHWQSDTDGGHYFLETSPRDTPPAPSQVFAGPQGAITTNETDTNILFNDSLSIEGLSASPDIPVTFHATAFCFSPSPGAPPPPGAGLSATCPTGEAPATTTNLSGKLRVLAANTAHPGDDQGPEQGDSQWSSVFFATGAGNLTHFDYKGETNYGQWYRLQVDGGRYIHWQSNDEGATYYLESNPRDFFVDNTAWPGPDGSVGASPTNTTVPFGHSLLIEAITNDPSGMMVFANATMRCG
jgi:hypothetical protein